MHEHHDVLIIGAGLSGISSAVHLERALPNKTYAILEAREAIGGTWDLFRYPGIRSDSDMYTLGYSFKPWEDEKAIADGATILSYIRQTASEYGIEDRIRFGHRVVRADWDPRGARWILDVERTSTGESIQMTAGFVHWCSGYYRYDEGFTPRWEGTERFGGQIVHPQHWPEDLDYTGKRVIVIGSGATAVTLVPAMSDRAAHVTMLQRSPSYIVSLPGVDPVARALRRRLPAKLAYHLIRLKQIAMTALSYQVSRRRPEVMKAFVRAGLRHQLPDGFDIDRHFKPTYDPWDQRLCVVPDGDLFRALRRGRASIVTDHIEAFTERGIRLQSGRELEADIIVTATGLNLQMLGGAQLLIDGRELDISQTVAYKGMMLSGVPNAAMSMGYTNASWTLKCDLICEYVCRLLAHMDERGYDYCVSVPPPEDEELEPLIDFNSGYVLRALDRLPKQGARPPWRLHQNYFKDVRTFRRAPLEDEAMRFGRVASAPAAGGTVTGDDPVDEFLAA